MGGGTALPPGFTGVSSVVAAGAGTGVAAVGAGATAGGGFPGGTAGLIVAGAIAAGVAAAVIVSTGGKDNPPASPSR